MRRSVRGWGPLRGQWHLEKVTSGFLFSPEDKDTRAEGGAVTWVGGSCLWETAQPGQAQEESDKSETKRVSKGSCNGRRGLRGVSAGRGAQRGVTGWGQGNGDWAASPGRGTRVIKGSGNRGRRDVPRSGRLGSW